MTTYETRSPETDEPCTIVGIGEPGTYRLSNGEVVDVEAWAKKNPGPKGKKGRALEEGKPTLEQRVEALEAELFGGESEDAPESDRPDFDDASRGTPTPEGDGEAPGTRQPCSTSPDEDDADDEVEVEDSDDEEGDDDEVEVEDSDDEEGDDDEVEVEDSDDEEGDEDEDDAPSPAPESDDDDEMATHEGGEDDGPSPAPE